MRNEEFSTTEGIVLADLQSASMEHTDLQSVTPAAEANDSDYKSEYSITPDYKSGVTKNTIRGAESDFRDEKNAIRGHESDFHDEKNAIRGHESGFRDGKNAIRGHESRSTDEKNTIYTRGRHSPDGGSPIRPLERYNNH